MAQNILEVNGVTDYEKVNQRNDYTHDLGVVVVPVAGRESAHRNIRLHGGVAKRTVRWTSARKGRPPVIPKAVDTDGDTLLGVQVSPHLPTPQVGGNGYDWTVEGVYTYVQKSPRLTGTDAFPVGDYPYPVQPVFSVATQLAQPYISQYYTAAVAGTKFTSLTNHLLSVVPWEGGQWTWPFLSLPGALSSEHLIQG